MSGVATVLQKFKNRWALGIFMVVVAALGYYYFFLRDTSETSVATYAVVETISLGTVSSGIETTGTIMAAQKLDLDVYKQAEELKPSMSVMLVMLKPGPLCFLLIKVERM